MDRHTIVTKTAAGLLEATGKTSALSHDVRIVLREIDGRSTIGWIADRLGGVPVPKLIEVLDKLQRAGFVRSFAAAPETIAPANESPVLAGGGDLDFTARRLQADAEDIARQAAATRAREEVRERARLETAMLVKAGAR